MVSLFNRFRLSNLITKQSSFNLFRYTSTNTSASSKTDGETKLSTILKQRFPNARLIDVKDTSCKYCRLKKKSKG